MLYQFLYSLMENGKRRCSIDIITERVKRCAKAPMSYVKNGVYKAMNSTPRLHSYCDPDLLS